MWLPYLHRIGRPFVIVTRTVPMVDGSRRRPAGPTVPVIFRPTLRSLEEVIVPTMTTTFYVNNAVRNTHFVERRELTHVWLNHGDSEKPACFNPVHAIYDKIFAAGQAGIDRYARHGVDIADEQVPRSSAVLRSSGSRRRAVRSTRSRRHGALRADLAGAVRRLAGLFAADGRAHRPWAARPGRAGVFRAHPFNYRFPEPPGAIQRIGRMLANDRRATGRRAPLGCRRGDRT